MGKTTSNLQRLSSWTL